MKGKTLPSGTQKSKEGKPDNQSLKGKKGEQGPRSVDFFVEVFVGS